MTLGNISKIIQDVFWIVAIGGSFFAFWRFFPESAEKRLWEKVKLSRDLLDRLDANPRALAAAYMLGGWTGRKYQSDPSLSPFEVTQTQLVTVLDPHRVPLTANEQYVRECFDNLLFHLEQCVIANDLHLADTQQLRPMFVTLLVGIQQSTEKAIVAYAAYSRYDRTAAAFPKMVDGTFGDEQAATANQ